MANNSNDNRKNLNMVISAWSQLFGSTNLPVELWIKTRLGYSKFFPKDDRIVVWAGECDNKLMDKILSYVDCFVFPSRGEGWGSPPLEAMATGCPVILTDWSGPTEYMSSDVCYPLRVREMVKIPRNTGDYPIGFFGEDVGSWAEPDYDHLVGLMEHVYTHYNEALEKGHNAYKMVKEKYHYGLTCERIYTLLEKWYE
jgi:glycosyltransferase involved in cell wall biosynthesis